MANNEAGKTRVDDAQVVGKYIFMKDNMKNHCLNDCVLANDCRIYDALSNYKVH